MHYLHLDPAFTWGAPQQQLPFEAFTFSGGEPHIRFQAEDLAGVEAVTLTHRIQSFNDMGLLLLAVDALHRAGVRHLEAVLPYFPGARQDRVMVAGEPLTAKVYANLLNALPLHNVLVYDAHSEVTPAVLERCQVVSNHRFIERILQDLSVDKLVSPDGGALKKIYKLSAYLGGVDVVEGSKIRDVRTGKLSGFQAFTEPLDGADCLIVDDICDGGGTFLGLAQTLKDKGAGKLYLAVSHGIFNKGVEVLAATFDHIYTTNSFRDIEAHPSLTQFHIAELL